MNDNIARAAAILQARIFYCEARDYWRTEQAEEALNILLARPTSSADTGYLVRNALSDARKKLVRRAAIYGTHAPAIDWLENQSHDDFEALLVETTDLLVRCLDPQDQCLLELAFVGAAANELAKASHLPVPRARERLSRARTRARAAREAA